MEEMHPGAAVHGGQATAIKAIVADGNWIQVPKIFLLETNFSGNFGRHVHRDIFQGPFKAHRWKWHSTQVAAKTVLVRKGRQKPYRIVSTGRMAFIPDGEQLCTEAVAAQGQAMAA